MGDYGKGKGQPPQEWSIIVRSYFCQTCGAGPGSPCMTLAGKVKTEPHMDRVNACARCLRCSARMAADWPLDVCDRCAVLLRIDVPDG